MTRFAWLLLAVVATSCGTNPPKVLCPTTKITVNQMASLPCGKASCPFPDTVQFTVAHALQVDTAWAASHYGCDTGQPTANQTNCPSDADLDGISVSIAGGSSAITLCAGATCTPTACPGPNCDVSNLKLTMDSDSKGFIQYQVLVNLSALGILPVGIGEGTTMSAAAVEVYGPGNSCEIDMDLTFNCMAGGTQCQ